MSKIDFTKPLENASGTPAEYLGRVCNNGHTHAVRIHGHINIIKEDGACFYGLYGIRNVEPKIDWSKPIEHIARPEVVIVELVGKIEGEQSWLVRHRWKNQPQSWMYHPINAKGEHTDGSAFLHNVPMPVKDKIDVMCKAYTEVRRTQGYVQGKWEDMSQYDRDQYRAAMQAADNV